MLALHWDRGAEQAVVGGLMLDASALVLVEPILQPGDFYDPAHQIVYEAIRALVRKKLAVDVVTLTAELRAMERLNTIGGTQFLGQLWDATPTAAHIEEHARVVAARAQTRRVVALSWDVVAKARDAAELDDDKLVVEAERRLKLATVPREVDELVSLGQLAEQIYDEVQEACVNGAEVLGMPTGLRDLDRLTRGLFDGHVWILAARPAMGKTAAAVQIGENTARVTGKSVFFGSLEMPSKELAERVVSSRSGVDHDRLRGRLLDAREVERLTSTVADLSAPPLYFHKIQSLSVARLRAVCRRLRASPSGLALVVLDYLQLMKHGGMKFKDRREEVEEISRELKLMAMEFGVPFLVLSQLNRKPEERDDHRPLLADLRETGAIEQDADLVSFLYRDEVYDKQSPDSGIAEWIVGKNRHGRTGTVRLRFRKELTRFDDLDEIHQDPQASARQTQDAPGAYDPTDDGDSDGF